MSDAIREYLADLKKNRIPAVRRQLAPLKDGSMHIFAGPSRSAMNEITQQEIGKLEQEITTYEWIIAEFEKQMTASDHG